MKVPIFGHVYPVYLVEDNSDIAGTFWGDKITINKKLTKNKAMFKETLLHEMGHALFYRGGLKQTYGITEDLEEIIVEQFAKMFNEAFTFYLKPQFKYLIEDD